MFKKIAVIILLFLPTLGRSQFTFTSTNWSLKDSITRLETHILVFDTSNSEIRITYPTGQTWTYWIESKAYNTGLWMFSCRDATVQRCVFFIYPPDPEWAITIEQEGYGTRKFFRN